MNTKMRTFVPLAASLSLLSIAYGSQPAQAHKSPPGAATAKALTKTANPQSKNSGSTRPPAGAFTQWSLYTTGSASVTYVSNAFGKKAAHLVLNYPSEAFDLYNGAAGTTWQDYSIAVSNQNNLYYESFNELSYTNSDGFTDFAIDYQGIDDPNATFTADGKSYTAVSWGPNASWYDYEIHPPAAGNTFLGANVDFYNIDDYFTPSGYVTDPDINGFIIKQKTRVNIFPY